MRFLLPYYVVVFAAVFVWPTYRLWRRERINAFVLPNADTAEGVIGLWFKALIAGVALTAAIVSFGGFAHLGPMRIMHWPALGLLGWTALLASLCWMALAQAQMGPSWRIGIDQNRTQLVRSGLFRRSRNPIFLGMRINLLGLFLVAPTGASLALLLVGEALMQVQVRLEEAHLGAVEGAEYTTYRDTVPRWI